MTRARIHRLAQYARNLVVERNVVVAVLELEVIGVLVLLDDEVRVERLGTDLSVAEENETRGVVLRHTNVQGHVRVARNYLYGVASLHQIAVLGLGDALVDGVCEAGDLVAADQRTSTSAHRVGYLIKH